MTAKETHFGFKKVAEEAKESLVGGVFSSVASKYDVMNDVMSLGIHRLWKKALVSRVMPAESHRVLDMAGGTGDLGFSIYKRYQDYGFDVDVTIADINEEMLEEGKKRAIDKNLIKADFKWQVQNGQKTDFKDESFDYYVIAYGIRNFTDPFEGLKEAKRILKPGGKFLCLEFSQVENEWFKKLYDFYSFNVIPKAGELITGDKDSYQYFVESIRMFPKPEEFGEMMKQAGFKDVRVRNLTVGLTTLYEGEV